MTEEMHYNLLNDNGSNPLRIPNDDPLLKRLQEEHGDRRYEVLQIGKDRLKKVCGNGM
jgi:hypothetical protein